MLLSRRFKLRVLRTSTYRLVRGISPARARSACYLNEPDFFQKSSPHESEYERENTVISPTTFHIPAARSASTIARSKDALSPKIAEQNPNTIDTKRGAAEEEVGAVGVERNAIGQSTDVAGMERGTIGQGTGNDRVRAQISEKLAWAGRISSEDSLSRSIFTSFHKQPQSLALSEYCRDKSLSRAADDLSWHLSVQALGLSSEDLDSDEKKEQEFLRLSNTIDELCFEGIQLGMIKPLRMSTVGLDEDDDDETPDETIARLTRATEYREKFLGSITAPR